MKVIITCEHGGNLIPSKYKSLFLTAHDRLKTHEGYDIGALGLAKTFSKFADFFFYSEKSRLLVELNRSPHHPKLFSNLTTILNEAEKKIILSQYYFPYRNAVMQEITKLVTKKEVVLHLSVHSFTPVFENKIRLTDVGFLYDPKRFEEKIFCKLWKEQFLQLSDAFKIRFNYPYLGKSDGFVTYLRKHFSSDQYIGIELEVNQKIMINKNQYKKLEKELVSSFKKTVASIEKFKTF